MFIKMFIVYIYLDKATHFGQTAFVLLFVLSEVFVQRILVHREPCDRPVERRYIQLVHVLGMRGAQHTQCAAMKGARERHDRQLRCTRRHVDHARLLLQVSEIRSPASLVPHVFHEHVLVRVLVGARPAHHGRQGIQSLRSHLYAAAETHGNSIITHAFISEKYL